MGRRQQQSNKTKNKSKRKGSTPTTTTTGTATTTKTIQQQESRQCGSWLNADPERIRYQHSRIRPYFSGCGRSVEGTFESIRDGKMLYSDLPPIQVIVGPDDNGTSGGPWYFSLNNRRLWVLKRCREEGLLEHVGNVVQVRVRKCKSANESKRYTLENCALGATFLRERPPGGGKDTGKRSDGGNGRFVDDALENVRTVTDGLTLYDNDVGQSRCLLDGTCQIQDGGVDNQIQDGGVDNQSDKCIDNDVCKSISILQKNVGEICNAGDDEEKEDSVDDHDESEEDTESSPPTYKNPFCIHGDNSSSSEEDSD